MSKYPRITFGMIVLNGEPFTLYNLRALYPYAHQIIVVEGSAPAAAGVATAEGHSTDGTLENLRRFKETEDPEEKLIIVTAEDEGYPNGFWPGEKHEQSGAYAKRATGDYLWQIDVDEFYLPADMQAIISMLRRDVCITTVMVKTLNFWGGFEYVTDGWYLRRGAENIYRVFKWGSGYSYKTHRPPTVYDDRGRNLRNLRVISGRQTARQGIVLYHYSLVFPRQVIEKCEYYGRVEWTQRSGAQRWAEESFMALNHPYRVHNVYAHPSWLERYDGAHPPQIEAMRRDLRSGALKIETRPAEDVDALLCSPWYAAGRSGLKVLSEWDRRWNGSWFEPRMRAHRLLRDTWRKGWWKVRRAFGWKP